MAIDTVTLAVSRKYTDQTVIGLGGLKGAPKPPIQGLSTDYSSLATFPAAVNAADGAVFIEVDDAKVFLKHDGSWYNITGADSNV